MVWSPAATSIINTVTPGFGWSALAVTVSPLYTVVVGSESSRAAGVCVVNAAPEGDRIVAISCSPPRSSVAVAPLFESVTVAFVCMRLSQRQNSLLTSTRQAVEESELWRTHH